MKAPDLAHVATVGVATLGYDTYSSYGHTVMSVSAANMGGPVPAVPATRKPSWSALDPG